MPSLYQQRAAYEKALLREIRPRLKGTKWKLSASALFKQRGDYYLEMFISVHRDSETTVATMRFKPMAVDPILWDILGIPENRNEPLSFRTWGAFTCAGIPIFEARIESEGHMPGDMADALVALCNEKESSIEPLLEENRFSDIVSAHPFQLERGAFSVTLVASLINEGDLDGARTIASACVSGALPSTIDFTSDGTSFHERALMWLESVA